MRRSALALALSLIALATMLPSAAAADPPPTVWAVGDSITYGTGLPAGQSWPAQLDELMGAGVQVRNLGVGGQAVAYDAGSGRMDVGLMSTLAATPAASLPSVILFAGGRNDLPRSADVGMGDTRWAIVNLAGALAQQYPSVRFQVLTVLPHRSDTGYAVALEDRRRNLNAWMRAGYGPSGQLVDVGDLLTDGAGYADVRYLFDSFHPNARGAAVIAEGVHSVLTLRGLV